jgi:hypothetical protein
MMPLRRPFPFTSLKLAVLHRLPSSLHQKMNQASIPDPVLDELHPSVVDGVEERRMSASGHPVDRPVDGRSQRIERVVRRSLRPEPMREPDKQAS